MDVSRRELVTAAAVAMPVLAAPMALTGCGSQEQAQTQTQAAKKGADKPLTVYLWDNDLLCGLAPYLHERMPEAQLQFIAGNNDLDLYAYLLEHGDLPDIITVRRFAGTEARDLRPHLLDFSSYDVVSEFSSYSLQYYKDEEGQVTWLPVCGIPQTIIANKTLFEECGLSLPQSYEEYAQACQALHRQGIKPYSLDLAQDWSAHEMLQAGGIGELTRLDGITWRAQAESAQGDIAFDDKLWGSIFKHTSALLKDSCFTQDDLSVDTASAMKLFTDGEAAMFHGSPVHLRLCQSWMPDAELVRVPYFSQASDEGYIYMMPSLHVAFNKDLEADPDRLECAMSVLEHMLSAQGQAVIADGSSVISFNPTVASITDGLAGLEDQVENNQYYIRYASQASFAASDVAVRGLVSGEMDEAQAFEAFRGAINAVSSSDAASVTFEATYPLALNEHGGRDAASAILSTVAEECAAQLALAPYYCFTSSIYQGECSQNRLSLLIGNKASPVSMYQQGVTGAQLKELLERNLAGLDGAFCPASVYELPVASGMKLSVKAAGAGFELQGVTVDGEPIDDAQEYSVLLTDGVASSLQGDLAQPLDDNLLDVWTQAIMAGRQPAAPQDYIEVVS